VRTSKLTIHSLISLTDTDFSLDYNFLNVLTRLKERSRNRSKFGNRNITRKDYCRLRAVTCAKEVLC